MKQERVPHNAFANNVVRFVRLLTHTKGDFAGQRFRLRRWQERILRRLFGTMGPDRVTRQYRTCYIEIPRKNGKTEMAAAVALYMLLGDDEIGGEVYSAAVDRDQASLVFKAAEQMVRNDPILSQRLEIIPSQRRMVNRATASFYRAIAADAPSAHGYNASAIIYDELHAAPNRELWDVLTTSIGARRQPLVLVITTAGYDRHSICWELHEYAEKILNGVIIDPTFLPLIYAAPPEADWLDERVWRTCNPALGDFRSLDEMRTAAAQAREIPARQNTFRRLYLCQWTESETRWLDGEAWAACGLDAIPVQFGGRRCWVGLDLSARQDLTAAVAVFPDPDGGVTVVPHFWLPGDHLTERSRRDHVPYESWVRDGYLELTSGPIVDYDAVYDYLLDLPRRLECQVAELDFDPWNASNLVSRLMQADLPCVEVRQTFQSLTSPCKELEKLVLARKLRHGNHPVLRWCADNVVVQQDAAGNLKPDKGKSTQRIDGIVALIAALARAIVAEEEQTSAYDERVAQGAAPLLVL